jgi:LPXTG-motif cell wall-anchored protein
MLKKLVTSGAVLAVLSTGAANVAQAQSTPDKAIYFTFDQPVTLPNKTLPAGKYLFRLADSLANRQIVQIYFAEGSEGGKLAAMMMTLPVSRSDAPEDAEIRFLETAADAPAAIATYWYPGQREGWEFIYPRSQATTIAKASKQPVLTTASDVSDDEMRTADLVRMDAAGAQQPATADSATMSASGRTARGQMEDAAASSRSAAAPRENTVTNQAPRSTATAQSSQTPPAPAPPQTPAASTPRTTTSAASPAAQSDVQTPAPARVQSSSGIGDDARSELPATASSMPTVALVGLLALAGALWLSRRAHA